MKKLSFTENLIFNDEKVTVSLILESDFSKEIRIAMKKGQEMKEHKAPFPIVVQIWEGNVEFKVGNEKTSLKKGDIITLKGNIPHYLKANENSVIRLTLSKNDNTNRVQKVTENS